MAGEVSEVDISKTRQIKEQKKKEHADIAVVGKYIVLEFVWTDLLKISDKDVNMPQALKMKMKIN